VTPVHSYITRFKITDEQNGWNDVILRNLITGVNVGPRIITITYLTPFIPSGVYDSHTFSVEFIGHDDLSLTFQGLVCFDWQCDEAPSPGYGWIRLTLAFIVPNTLDNGQMNPDDVTRPPLDHLVEDFDDDIEVLEQEDVLAFSWWEEGF
jgi:hypothetical protein